MKLFRWMCFAYLAFCFFICVYLGERYIYYSTGLFGITKSPSKYAKEDLEYYDYQPFGCKICKGGFATLRTVLASNVTIGVIAPIVKLVCTISTRDPIMCGELFDEFAYRNAHNFLHRFIEVNYICSGINVCDDYTYKAYDPQEYIDRMMKNQPPIDRKYPKNKPQKLIRMLQLSDAHVDRGYLEGSNPDCKAPSCCRYGYGQPKEEIPGYWGFVGRCDIPMRTAEVGFEYSLQQNPDFIIWTGDNLDHYIWFQTYENQFFNQRYLK